MWRYNRNYEYPSSRNYNSTPVKPTKFKITLYSADGTKINTWTGTAVRHENGFCKFYNETTGSLIQIVGTVVVE